METNYTRKLVRCSSAGLKTEKDARDSLERSGRLAKGTEVGALWHENGVWVASIFEPRKVASPPFPPDNDNESEDKLPEPKAEESGPSEDEDDSSPDEARDGLDSDKSESKPKPKGKSDKAPSSGGESETLALLHQILELLAGGAGPMMGGPAGGPPPGPPMPPPGPPKPPGPPAGGPPGGPPGGGNRIQEVIHKRVMKPGEAAPGQTPIGAPALSSLQAFAASTNGNHSLAEAKTDLEAKFAPQGFKVAQIRRTEDNKIAALLARR